MSVATRRAAVCWIAILALLLGSFGAARAQLPGAARAEAAGSAICSAHAAVVASNPLAPVDPSPGDTPPGQAAGHCLYCSLHHDALAPPASATLATPVPQFGATLPRLFLRAPRTQPVWAASQARAPPAAA